MNHHQIRAATHSPHTDSLFAATPILRGQLHHLQTTLARQMNTPGSSSNHWAWHSAHRAPKRHWSTTSSAPHINNSWTHGHHTEGHPHLPSSTKNTGAHLQQSNNKAHEADDRCFSGPIRATTHACTPSEPLNQRVTYAPKRQSSQASLLQPHRCPSALLHRSESGSGVDQRHPALARCLADLVTAHTWAPRSTVSRPSQGYHGNPSLVLNLKEHARTSCSTCVDIRMQDSSRQSAPAEATWPNLKGRRSSTDTLASTWLARTNVHQTLLFSDSDHPPTAIRDAWAAIQTTLPKQQLRAVTI